MIPLAPADLLGSLEIDKMDDTGMYLWAGILTVASLAVSWGIAMGWQRWRAAKKQE